MKHTLNPNDLMEWVALKANLYPRPVYDTMVVNIQSQCIMTAVKCGLFNALLHQRKTLEALAQECEIDAGFLSLLLGVLVSCNYVVKRNGHYQLARKMRKWFSKKSPTSLQNFILLAEMELPAILGQLDELLKNGKSINMHRAFTEKSYWKVYQAAMLELAKQVADTIKNKVPVKKGANVLLDIGGAHGLLGAAICRANGMSESVVLDLPQAIEFAKPLAVQENIDDIVKFRALNILEQPIDIPADAVLVANFLHHFNEPDVLSILKKIHNNLTEGGTIVILDFTANSHRGNDCALAAASLFFRLTSDSKCYTVDENRRLLRAAGFSSIKAKKLLKAPYSHLITARKRAVKT